MYGFGLVLVRAGSMGGLVEQELLRTLGLARGPECCSNVSYCGGHFAFVENRDRFDREFPSEHIRHRLMPPAHNGGLRRLGGRF